MEGVRCLSAKELEDIDALHEYKEYGHDAKDPARRLTLCCYKKRGNNAFYWFIVTVEVSRRVSIFNTFKEDEARRIFYLCCYSFWSVTTCIPVVFTVKVLTKLMELIEQHDDSWSIAHMCVSLPLPEETMMTLLTSESFKDYFMSTHRPDPVMLCNTKIWGTMFFVSNCQSLLLYLMIKTGWCEIYCSIY